MSKENRKEIKGIDPKSYGSFDKVMDKARRVSRYVLPGVAVALTASCTPEMINSLAKTVETPDVSPLPSDFTKTPMSSPTEANYELTPTVQNPAIQEPALIFSAEIEEIVDYEWIDSLLDKLGDEYYYNDKYPSIWFKKNNHDGTPERSVPVFVFEFKNSITFNEGVEGGRETVRYANYENVKVFSDGSLSLIDNYYEKNYSFSEVSMSWWEKSE